MSRMGKFMKEDPFIFRGKSDLLSLPGVVTHVLVIPWNRLYGYAWVILGLDGYNLVTLMMPSPLTPSLFRCLPPNAREICQVGHGGEKDKEGRKRVARWVTDLLHLRLFCRIMVQQISKCGTMIGGWSLTEVLVLLPSEIAGAQL